MKKFFVLIAVIGAVVVLRPLIARRSHKMREHCEAMAAHCRELVDSGPETRDRAPGGGPVNASGDLDVRRGSRRCA